jgi:hypothetical protein
MLETIVGVLGAAVLTGFAWVFQLGNRVTKLEASQDGLQKFISEKFADVSKWLERLEAKLDNYNR